jgi:transposase
MMKNQMKWMTLGNASVNFKRKRKRKKLEKEGMELEKENIELVKKRKKLEKENKNLKEQIVRFKNSLMALAASEKTAEAGGVPSSKTFYRRNRQEGTKKPTGGQPGHKGHGRKKPTPTSSPIEITLEECPKCNSHLDGPVKNAEQRRTITDIPMPEHITYEVICPRYYCHKCGKMVRGYAHWLPPNQQFGPAVACWIAYQRMLGLSLGKVRSSLVETYCIEMSEATLLKLEKWVADVLHGDYQRIKDEVVGGKIVNADETSFRVDGKNGWLWVFTNALASLYIVAPSRGHEVPEKTLERFDGVLGRDAWKPYDWVKCAAHQLDLLHVNSWLERAEIKHGIEPRTILSSKPVKLTRRGRPPKQFIEFVDGLRHIFRRAIEYSQKILRPSLKSRERMVWQLKRDINILLDRESKDKDIIRISKELRKRMDMLFTFIKHDDVPWHNNDAERAIRQGVLHRKISGGRRTWPGAGIFETLLSVYETTKKKGEKFFELVKMRLSQGCRVETLGT